MLDVIPISPRRLRPAALSIRQALPRIWVSRGPLPSASAEDGVRDSEDSQHDPCLRRTKLGDFAVPSDWPVQGEVRKTFIVRLLNGFFRKYMSGPVILDVGYRGGRPNAVPIFPHAVGVDLDYPGYDGNTLPFEDRSVDTVFLEPRPGARLRPRADASRLVQG